MSLLKCLLTFLLIPCIFLAQVQAQGIVNFIYNSRLKGFRLNTTVLMEKVVSEKINCVMECGFESCCRSINYKKTSSLKDETNCEILHNVVYISSEKLLENNSSYDYVYLVTPQKVYNVSCFRKLLDNNSQDQAISDGDRVNARWTNNKYYAGEITSISEEDIHILFDDGDRMTHPLDDVTAVFANKVPDSVEYKDHVIAPWQGSYKKYIGYVIEVSESQGFKVRFDDNDEAWYHKNQLRILPDASTAHDVGARVFARRTNGLYYKGFVSKSNLSSVSINYDDGDKITLPKNDKAAVILDKIPEKDQVKIRQEVIGYLPCRVIYYAGDILYLCDDGSKYFLKFRDGDERCEAVYEIRTVP